jgi:hypothetical protein
MLAYYKHYVWIIGLVSLNITPGCAPSVQQTAPLFNPGAPLESPACAVVAGDWDDVEAAVIAAASRAEVALTKTDRTAPDRFEFSFATLGGGPATMSAALRVDGLIRLEARIGRLGEPQQERRLIAATAARLRELKGKTYAPIRGWIPPPPILPAAPP